MSDEVQERVTVVTSTRPIDLARDYLFSEFETGMGVPGLLHARGQFWEWAANQWQVRANQVVEDAIREWLAGCVEQIIKKGDTVERPLEADNHQVAEVLSALATLVRAPFEETPRWMGDDGGPANPKHTIAFQDVLVDLVTLERRTRTAQWFDGSVVPCAYDPDAKCPVWERCLGEWSGGDPAWSELLERWMAYNLTANREYGKWMFMCGKVRGGKGTIVRVLESLMTRGQCKTRSLWQLATRFGLDGLQTARMLSITEAGVLDTRSGDMVAQILKTIVGQDEVSIEQKGRPFLDGLRLSTAITVQGNQIPNLGNIGRGLSSKMLVLPFTSSFDGIERQPDFHLSLKLQAELPGIAHRVLQAGFRLEAEVDSGKKFPTPTESNRIVEAYHLQNNPLDHFLKACFKPIADRFVTTERVWEEWLKWRKKNHVVETIPRNQLAVRLEQESSWNITKCEKCVGNEKVRSVLMGMALLGVENEG